jgi:hypothetical protein
MQWHSWSKYAIVNFKYKTGDVDKVIRMKGYAISKVFDGPSPTYILWELPSTWIGKFENVEGAKLKAEELKKASQKEKNNG